MKKNNSKITVQGNGSVELETIVREDLEMTIAPKVDALAKKYFRDIAVEITVNIK